MVAKPILVTGGSGQVGGAVVRSAARQGIKVWAPTRSELDLLDPASLSSAITSDSWSAIINCAAYTAVDKAEAEAEYAYAVNASGPAVLAEAAGRRNIPFVHVSTDYVFDGVKESPYVENDPVNPVSVYGKTKEAGEAAVRAANPHHAIIRTAWVLSADGANFLNTMLRLGAERPELGVVSDQIGSPTNADDIAEALLIVTADLQGRSGTWHFVNDGEASWHELAMFIFEHAARCGYSSPRVRPITTAEYPTPARRPANSRLSTAAIERDFGIRPRPWQDAVGAILKARLN